MGSTLLEEKCKNCGMCSPCMACAYTCEIKQLLTNSEKPSCKTGEVEKFLFLCRIKYILSVSEGRDVGWDNAANHWISRGYARLYREFYSRGKSPLDLWNEIMDRSHELTKMPELLVG